MLAFRIQILHRICILQVIIGQVISQESEILIRKNGALTWQWKYVFFYAVIREIHSTAIATYRMFEIVPRTITDSKITS